MKKYFLLFHFILLALLANAQAPKTYSASDIQQKLKKLNVLTKVLYVAAHPDDENTRLITYFANEELATTAYLSITRGDGGQNLIGPEIKELLGVIRTQELLQARRIDGGQQFFSSAIDFGYSKHPDETFNIWDRKRILEEMVFLIRSFRPDVIITRFNTTPGTTHGHHTASAILAEEAFKAAGDKSVFPEQLKKVETWQAKRIYWNTSWWFYGNEKNFDKSDLIEVNVGKYNPLLGNSYTEISAQSRSMHKSQGFGASESRGKEGEYLKYIAGEKAEKHIFDGINTSWTRVKGGEKINEIIKSASASFNPEAPYNIVPQLISARGLIEKLEDEHWKKLKLEEINEIIKACSGLFIEATTGDFSATHGENLTVNFEAVNRSPLPVILKRISVVGAKTDTTVNLKLEDNTRFSTKSQVVIPESIPISQPYWLQQPGSKGMFKVDNIERVKFPENPTAMEALFELEVSGEKIAYKTPLVFKHTDPVEGEQYEPFGITPPVFININEKILLFADDQPKLVSASIIAGRKNVKGQIKLNLPSGWRANPSVFDFSLTSKNESQTIQFFLESPKASSSGKLRLEAVVEGKTYSKGLITVKYQHIPVQRIFPESEATVIKADIKKRGSHIAYIMGAGDDIPSSLSQIGYNVDVLNERSLSLADLQKYDAVVAGVRVYNTLETLKFLQNKLLSYVENGGTLIVQYNTNQRMVTDKFAPFPITVSRERVTVEEAPIDFINPKHPLLNTPNKITVNDFEGWEQERGLYFPASWSSEYETIISTNDPGGAPLQGGVLVAKYGKGHYIYTSYSWFRQLPAGVPGAYRLFANMVSIGK